MAALQQRIYIMRFEVHLTDCSGALNSLLYTHFIFQTISKFLWIMSKTTSEDKFQAIAS